MFSKKMAFFFRSVASFLIAMPLFSNDARAMLPIFITATQNLNFGSFSCTGVSGEVIINTAGSRSVTGDVIALSGAGLEKAGVLSIVASSGMPIVLSMTTTNFNLTNGGTGVLVVDNFQLVTNAGGSVNTITLTTTTDNLSFGATLNAVCAQPGGVYVGNFSVNANYM